MTGYTDGFTDIDGDLITAPSFSQEYAAIGAAFDASTGHVHDGSLANGALIPLIADAQDLNEVICGSAKISFSTDVGSVKTLQITVEDGAILPGITNDIDLGSPVLMFKDGYLTTLAIGTGTIVDTILDDGTMTANSATALVTQQSIVAYTANVTIDGGTY